jgi:hypothetical protein
MAVTSQVFAHTPLAGSGLSIVDANKQREFADWVEAKEVRNIEFTEWVKERSEPFGQIDIEIGQSYAPFVATTLGAQAGAGDEVLTVASTALLRVGDQIEIKEFYSGSTTEYDDTRTEIATITVVTNATTMTVDRHEGAVTDGSYFVHPSGSVVTVKGRALNYNDPFSDAITYRGDSIRTHPQRFESGEVTYDYAAVNVEDFEAPNGHWMKDVMFHKNDLPYKRNWAFINGIRRTGTYTTTPKIPYRMGGAVWFASQVASNIIPISGQLNLFDMSDVFEDLATNHADGAGDTIWMAPRMLSIWSEMLLPYKGMFGPNDTTLDMTVSRVKSAFGTVDGVKTDNQWPPSKILMTSRADWERGHFQNMDWQYIERDAKNLGAFQRAWNMGGDFALVCNNVSHQRLLTAIDTRKDNYASRTAFL